jgi:hypothetical protein
MACDSQTLINTAYSQGYAKLSDRDLRECIVASACAGGGGGGGGTVTCGAANPTVAPTGCGVYVKQSGVTSGIWVWDGAAWQQLI